MVFVVVVISCYMRKRIHELFFIYNPKLQFLLTNKDQRIVMTYIMCFLFYLVFMLLSVYYQGI